MRQKEVEKQEEGGHNDWIPRSMSNQIVIDRGDDESNEDEDGDAGHAQTRREIPDKN